MKISPPIVFAIGLVLGIAASFFFPTPFAVFPEYRGAGWALIALGLLLAMAAGRTLRQAGTGVLPGRPSTRLVIEGPFRFTRNPIYVAMALAYLGIAVLLYSLWTVLLLPVVLLVLERTVIHPEEVYLERLFGAEYIRYKDSVRRWL